MVRVRVRVRDRVRGRGRVGVRVRVRIGVRVLGMHMVRVWLASLGEHLLHGRHACGSRPSGPYSTSTSCTVGLHVFRVFLVSPYYGGTFLIWFESV